MKRSYQRILRHLAKQPENAQLKPADIAAELGMNEADVVLAVKDLMALGHVRGLSSIGNTLVVFGATATGRQWLHENSLWAQSKRLLRWGSSALAASASTYGLRQAFHEAMPALAGLLAILGGTTVGVLIALGAHRAAE